MSEPLTKSYYCVYIHNPYNYAHYESPAFYTEDECYQWLNKYYIDTGCIVEIREVKTTRVPSDLYERYSFDLGKDLGYSDQDIASKLVWEHGCIVKDYYDRHKPKQE